MRRPGLALCALAAAMSAFAGPPPAPTSTPVPSASHLVSHPKDALEWWYWTGHLRGERGREYGFQLTFFRVREVHLAHFAWTDPAAGTFTFDEKTHLALPGIAGASESRLDVSNEDWSARDGPGGEQRLRAEMAAGELDLALSPAKSPVFHGEGGISRKGPGEDEFSNYASITRLSASGTFTRKGKSERLTGTAWFDHEWGPGGMPEGIAGWDWFALQLADGSELMLYRMRRKGGTASPFSAGTYVPASGPPRPIAWKDVRLAPKTTWNSPRTKAVYPAVWTLSVESIGLDATITPILADQELVTERSTNVTYWEGACRVSGEKRGRPVDGRAYVEMTGYAGRDVPGFAPGSIGP